MAGSADAMGVQIVRALGVVNIGVYYEGHDFVALMGFPQGLDMPD